MSAPAIAPNDLAELLGTEKPVTVLDVRPERSWRIEAPAARPVDASADAI